MEQLPGMSGVILPPPPDTNVIVSNHIGIGKFIRIGMKWTESEFEESPATDREVTCIVLSPMQRPCKSGVNYSAFDQRV